MSAFGADGINRFRRLLSDWWIVATSGLLAGCLALLFSFTQTAVYESSATLYVTASVDVQNPNAAYQSSLASQQRVASYATLVGTDVVVSRALEMGGFSGVSLSDVRAKLSSDAGLDTALLTVRAQGDSPVTAARLANAVAESMTEYVSGLETPAAGGSPLAKLTLVSPAVPESKPVSPRTARNVGFGVLAGFLIGFGISLVRQRMDSRVRAQEDLRAVSDAPVLGSVPSEKSLERARIVDFGMGFSAAAEAFRQIRTNLAFVRVDDPVSVVAVTSAVPGEGKTTTTLNLAVALAESGVRVVVVDADLRRPRLHEFFGVNRAVGLTGLLRGDLEIGDAVQDSGFANMDIVACGPTAPNPSELLGSKRAAEVFAELNRRYDFVLVDVPPILPVTDAVVISQHVDGMLVVVRAGHCSRVDLVAAVDRMLTANMVQLGFVLNGVGRESSVSYRYDYSGAGSVDVD